MVDAEVQLAREDYAIVSLPNSSTFGFLSVDDFNTRDNETARLLPLGTKHSLIVRAHPSESTGAVEPLLLLPFSPPLSSMAS